ncbi:hypothetical protein KP509_34G042400 [Ceratopteris richardii]|uniref:Uncharacterized protein n=1 Tax=Ceratopteris richardii TaxID=49495 RepID=A0A8T2QKS7_CERRI|nr:hypothetical protein KP509_34G042400 [Ceratopteris richardii]
MGVGALRDGVHPYHRDGVHPYHRDDAPSLIVATICFLSGPFLSIAMVGVACSPSRRCGSYPSPSCFVSGKGVARAGHDSRGFLRHRDNVKLCPSRWSGELLPRNLAFSWALRFFFVLPRDGLGPVRGHRASSAQLTFRAAFLMLLLAQPLVGLALSLSVIKRAFSSSHLHTRWSFLRWASPCFKHKVQLL